MELLPCPFCASNRLNRIYDDYNNDCISCSNCYALNRIEKWNTRSSPWISVKDQTPPIDELILISTYYSPVSIFPHRVKCTFVAKKVLSNTSILLNDDLDNYQLIPSGEMISFTNITHWMPLLEPPKETE